MACSEDAIEEDSFLPPVSGYSLLEVELLGLVNNYRKDHGMAELGRLQEISQQAQLHSLHMAGAKEICHHNFGSRLKALKEQVGAKAMGENVAQGYRTSEAFFKAWLNSPHHKKIMEEENTHFGISAIQAEDKTYVTLIFIRK